MPRGMAEEQEQPQDLAPDDDRDHDDGPWRDMAWQQLPAPERAEHVMRECAAGNWRQLLRHPIDDSLLDVIAAVRAVREDNTAALAVILSNGSSGEMLVSALKIIAEMMADSGTDAGTDFDYWGVWSSYALARS